MKLGMGEADEVYVMDDFLPKDMLSDIQSYYKSRPTDQWMKGKTTTPLDPPYLTYICNIDDAGQEVLSILIEDRVKVDELPPFVERLRSFLQETVGMTTLYRMKINKIAVRPTTPQSHNIPHWDHPDIGHWSMVLYLNDSVGDTVIFDQTRQVLLQTKMLTEAMRVTPREGRAVIFPSRLMHTSSTPDVGEARVVANIVFSVV